MIELPDATDFNKTLIMTDLEWQLFGHLHGHVYLELGTGVRSDSSNSTLKSASRHFHLRQPCLPTSPLPVPSAPFGRSAVQLDDLLCSSGGSCQVHPPKTRTTR